MVWDSFNWHQIFSLRASSPFGGYREKYTRERHARGDATVAASPDRSRVLARLASLAQIGELARRLSNYKLAQSILKRKFP